MKKQQTAPFTSITTEGSTHNIYKTNPIMQTDPLNR